MAFSLETEIQKWRDHLRSTGSVAADDLAELEDHLRESVDELTAAGLTKEEAFLIAVRRMGDVSELGGEFSKVPAENLWRQMVLTPEDDRDQHHAREVLLVVVLALLGGLLGKVPAMLGLGSFTAGAVVYVRNMALFALPGVFAYLAWKRSLRPRVIIPVAAALVISAVLMNVYPSHEPGDTAFLSGIHLPVALWLLMCVAYGGTGWRRPGVRMDFIRFTGEAFIYAVLIGCGGVVLTVAAAALFDLAGIQAEPFIGNYLVVFGGLAIPTVAVFLVERKKTIIENIAPVLARVFTPLFLVLIVSVLIAVVVTGGIRENREMLIVLDLVLAIVLALVLYTMSSRGDEPAARVSDWLTFLLLLAALVLDIVALWAIVFRLTAYGLTANKLAAFGANVLVLVNLAGFAAGQGLLLARKLSFQRIVRGQMTYLVVYFAWALVVAFVFPLVFVFT